MATTKDYIEYACEQITELGDVRYKSMMGEYLIYINNKSIITVCDNTCFVKIKDEISELMKGADIACPYKGAKEHYILDIENKDLCLEVLSILEKITPLPKPKKKKQI